MREKEFGLYLPLSPIILVAVCLISEMNKLLTHHPSGPSFYPKRTNVGKARITIMLIRPQSRML